MFATILAERYQLGTCIALGGMGEVWRGADLLLSRLVAIKLIRAKHVGEPEAAARFRAEARLAARLNHRGIAKVYDYDDSGRPFLVMELIDGPSLAVALAAGPLPPWRALDIVAQVARALHASHRAGVIHRDVKPANLLLSVRGQVKLTDFGIAELAGRLPAKAAAAAVRTVWGTPAYLAPERVDGSPATPACDLYSLGIVLYECLTGARPYIGTWPEIARAQRTRPFPALPQPAPEGITTLLADLTAKDPQARPRSAAQVANRAARLRDGLRELEVGF